MNIKARTDEMMPGDTSDGGGKTDLSPGRLLLMGFHSGLLDTDPEKRQVDTGGRPATGQSESE